MNYTQSPYFHVAHARDLSGWDRVLFRMLEILPGLISLTTICGIVFLSFYAPVIAAYLIIAFDLFWLLKTFYLSLHQRHSWKRLRHNMALDWRERIATLKYEHLHHMVLLPYYKESEHTVDDALKSLAASDYDHSRLIIVLASEERAGKEAQDIGHRMLERYRDVFGSFILTTHPDNLTGEIRGKGPNITYAANDAKYRVVRPKKIPYENIIVSAFDIDTIIEPQYFLCLSWYFLTTENPHKASFQPVPLYNNNIWEAPAVSRVAAFSSTFWQMIQQERAEKLTTFSSHAISFKALEEVGFWQKNMISDDSRIFWNLYLANDGNYRTIPISYPVSMDANLATSTWQTLVNIYHQHFRWMWGVENIPYMLFGFIKNKNISFREKVFHTAVQIEGFWSLATAPIMILLLGWLPLVLGGEAFRDTVLSYNLPYITRNLMIVSMFGLVLAAIIAFSFMPRLSDDHPRRRLKYITATLQWLLVPFTIIIFGALPGLHAQMRLMLGKYVGAFWVTPKHRVTTS
ncbi:MAG: glycosyltransferase family 2 protein [Candidatus Pacebacteria bacterium]|nr:glycosyltransferase family 2 protein [Candidatus Paceibacterota bacterium]